MEKSRFTKIEWFLGVICSSMKFDAIRFRKVSSNSEAPRHRNSPFTSFLLSRSFERFEITFSAANWITKYLDGWLAQPASSSHRFTGYFVVDVSHGVPFRPASSSAYGWLCQLKLREKYLRFGNEMATRHTTSRERCTMK